MSDVPLDLSNPEAMRRDMAEQFVNYMMIKANDPDGPGAAVAAIRNADSLEQATTFLFGFATGVFDAGVVYALDRVQGRLAVDKTPAWIPDDGEPR